MAAKNGQKNSEKYRKSRKVTGEFAKASATPESRSKGGKKASEQLVAWQKKNAKEFKKILSEKAKKDSYKKHIPHFYLGMIYPGIKELRKKTKMSNCGFYAKLKRGEIVRLPKDFNQLTN